MKKILISLIAVGILASIVYLVSNSKPPKPTITVENKTVEVVQGSYCWQGFMNAQCVDTISPPELIQHYEMKPVVVSPGAALNVKFNRKPNTLSVSIWENENDSGLLAPKEKGIYIYTVSASWKKGSS